MSCIYEMSCDECGKELDFKVALDSGDDLIVKVYPCPDCLEAAKEEGKTED